MIKNLFLIMNNIRLIVFRFFTLKFIVIGLSTIFVTGILKYMNLSEIFFSYLYVLLPGDIRL